VESGETIDLTGGAAIPGRGQLAGKNARPTNTFIDKHSTGGVGDKVSLVLLPILASLDFKVAKMSGRSLGHTGGTIDKLESIPGFNTKLSSDEMLRVVEEVGCCIVEQSANLVPADKLFYALRDATDTVSELGLIAASVMSKKIACGAPYILLDVKCGGGAFFKHTADARDFAALAIRLGTEFGRKVSCVISRMDQPLGMAVGNAIEVLEALRFLEPGQWNGNQAPTGLADLATLIDALLRSACDGAGVPQADLPTLMTSGEPLAKFEQWIKAQGGDLEALVGRHSSHYRDGGKSVVTPITGYVGAIDAAQIAEVLATLGAGRTAAGAAIDPRVGLLCRAKTGQQVSAGEMLSTLYTGEIQPDKDQLSLLSSAFQIIDQPTANLPVVLDTLS
jgi:pyrimidine-nucleoside phosphorylase